MSSERFDKLIKKNLESVRPEYQPRAWDRFSRKLPATGFFPWVTQYGGWALAGMMLAGWFTTLYTLRENQEIIRQLSTTSGQNMMYEGGTLQSEELSDAAKVTKSVNRTDTVYILKKTIIEHRHFYKSKIEDEGAGQKEEDQIVSKTSVNSDIKNPNENEENLLTKKSDINTDEAENSIIKDKNPIVLNTEPDTQAVHDTTAPSLEDQVTAILDSSRTIQAYNYKFLAALVDSISSKKAPSVVVKPKKPPFRLSTLQPRLGMESLLSLHSYGIGPVVELFPTENLGLSIGIQASTLEAENHKALRDYNSATGKFFLVQYRSYLPSKFDRIEDISIKTTVVSLPVSLKYYIPLKKNISLFVQSGTSLDLSAYQQVDFESYLNNSKRRNTFETDAKPNFFHNFMFGAGVQYKRSRVLAQLSPFYVYDFRNIENTPSGSNLGLRASLWLNLFK